MKKPTSHFHSICFQNGASPCHPADVCPETRTTLSKQYHAELEKCSPRETWIGDAHYKSAPYPILGNQGHQRQLEELGEALVIAITDIVERWWSDSSAGFPLRMPINPVEEKLLQWLEQQEKQGHIRPFRAHQGSWRPDFLLESGEDAEGIENFRICEINARFWVHGFLFTAFGQQALKNMGVEEFGVRSATEPEKVIEGLKTHFDISRPLHLLKGDEAGYDIHMFVPYAQRVLGMEVRVIRPETLRLVPANAPGGYKLYCLASAETKQATILNDAGERLEEVFQVGMELYQRELLSLSFEMVQQIALRCFNDLRTIFLVHDKRMLGIVLEELQSLTLRGVITARQAAILEKGLVPTTIPGSEKLTQLISSSQNDTSTKDALLLKPVRSGKGAGILFGDSISQSEWLSHLQNMRDPYLHDGKTTYVIQKVIEQKRYEVLLEEGSDIGHFPLIGTFHIANGVLLGLGLWRSGPGRICALSRGGSWVVSVIQQ